MTNQPQIAFHPVQLSDAVLIFAWRQRPHVARWWNIHPWEQSYFNFVAFERELRDELAIGWQSLFLITQGERPITS